MQSYTVKDTRCDKKKFKAYILGLIDILGMSKVLARWLLQLLTDVQRKSWLHISRYLLSHYEDDPSNFIERVVT